MLKVGITGGIGSGKSTVSRIFKMLGIPAYDADSAAKRLMQQDQELIAAVKSHFGLEAYDRFGKLNSAFLAKIVFEDKEKLKILNALVHPVTIRDADQWAIRQTSPYVLKEAALIFESEAFHYVDKVIGVSAPAALRIQRIMHRDNISRDEVLKRMDNQMDEETKMRLCDYIIYNDEQQAVIPQVMRIHEQLSDLGTLFI